MAFAVEAACNRAASAVDSGFYSLHPSFPPSFDELGLALALDG